MLAFISHAECMEHDTGMLHPDQPERISAIENQLIMSGLDFVVRRFDAPKVTRAELERVHDAAYLDRIYALDPVREPVEIDGDTVMSPGTLRAAERAAGAGVLGVDAIMAGEVHSAFCAVRPPGHHAERGRAMGFCLFDNIAVAAAHALEAHGLSRVAIVDFDVHHGNGTEDIFRDEPRVLFCSSFQHPFYPFTGHASDTANLVDVPLSAGAGGKEFRTGVREHWLPALEAFAPEFLFISAGFDGHVADDMSHLQLTDDDYVWVTQELLAVARRHAGGRVLSMLEGGYEPGALARSVAAHMNVLIG
ncbi:histone deacetylase family protein [Aquicoccus porphyridii]|uniref:Histone deacetylase family protein n=1 Tax=Aquicoccus porphyridii TaxID=1852029 RepID=A0A5A9Z670_9RHOB|nr:histone deacetylase family protein [Aquicoccus porphyridii]KAA0912628.1 histone deacetylase family protein [Aquicoccus porphyridii]RAI55438.1 histone deacetylase family protein [Rhodobacteraceae bacterium AsT-22]